MGSELLIDPLPKKTMSEVFWEAYPAYLAMGMPSDEYWDGDAQACVAYRKAYKEKLELHDAMLWRPGLYVYHALCCVAPYFNSIKPKKPEEYISHPFGIATKRILDPDEKEEQKAIDYLKAWADKFNAQRKQNNGN